MKGENGEDPFASGDYLILCFLSLDCLIQTVVATDIYHKHLNAIIASH
jgi:hypothetical protein